MIKPVPFGRKIKGLIVGQPARATAGAAEPGRILIRRDHPRLRAGRIERKNPAALVVLRTRAEHGLLAVRRKGNRLGLTAPSAPAKVTAAAAVFDLRGRHAHFTMLDILHFARHHIDDSQPAMRNAIAYARPARNVFGEGRIRNIVGNVRRLRTVWRLRDGREHELAIGRKLQLSHGLPRA